MRQTGLAFVRTKCGLPCERLCAEREMKMKREFVTVLILLMFFGLSGQRVQASGGPGESLTKKILLDSESTAQIPRYIREDGITYRLDESSIEVEEIGRNSSEGARVVTKSWKVENLPDNDLERIEKTKTEDGISWELLCVIYEVTKEDEDGIPVEYSALCEYGGLEKYSSSYPSKWQAVCRYDMYSIMEIPQILTEQEEYVYTNTLRENGGTEIAYGDGHKYTEEKAGEEEEPLPEPKVKRYALKRISPEAGEREEKFPDFPFALVAVIVGAGAALPFIIWIFLLTAPIFARKENRKYRYIGRIRLRKEEDLTAYLTERLAARADLPVFKIRLRKGIREKLKAGVLQIHCPDGRRITAIAGREVRFTLERE